MANYFLNRYHAITGDSPDSIAVAQKKRCLRVNTLKISSQELKKRLTAKGVTLTPVPFLEDAFYYSADFSLGATEEYLLGYYYLQDAASQLPALAANNIISKNWKDLVCLDMAASPGGKTTQLAAVMNNEGKIIAIDANANRIDALTNNIERCGVQNTQVFLKEAEHIDDFEIQFDLILLDAPCSGNFAIDKKWFSKRKPEDMLAKARDQKQLIQSALAALKPDGTLIYSTCSLEPEENEAVLSEVLTSEKLVEMDLKAGDEGITSFQETQYREDMKHARRFWPHKHGTQGFFVAAIRK